MPYCQELHVTAGVLDHELLAIEHGPARLLIDVAHRRLMTAHDLKLKPKIVDGAASNGVIQCCCQAN